MTGTLSTKSWNTLSPLTLEEISLDFICKNIENLTFEVQEPVGNFNKLAFKVPVFLHEQLAEAILRQLTSSNRLTLKILTLFLDRTTCRLKRACIQGSNIREIGLRLLLMHHTITDLDLRNTEITFSLNIISSLEGLECTSFLKRLNISSAKNGLESTAVCSFKNLMYLDISKNSIDDSDLKKICNSLTKLEELNISCNPICKVESFGIAKQRLKSLKAYNCPVAWNCPIDFAQFMNLRHLDISRKPTRHMLPGDDAEKLEMLLSQKGALEDLEVLDISGTQRVMDSPLEVFLSGHPKLTFLGLCKTGSSYAYFLPKDIEITGEATEQQILSSLQHYPDRASYMTESLSRLFHISKNWLEQRFEVLQYVLPPMEMHPKDLRMQMASTACIFNLTRSAKNQHDLHPTILGKIASLVLKAMSSFTNKHELIRNCLLILDSPLMLRYAKFDYYDACMSAMDALCQFINDLNIVRLATKICAVLTAKISNYETIALGTDRHFKTLLNIVKDKVDSQRSDYVLSVTLSVLWNLTDDAHCTCQLFVDGQGLKLFIQVLKEFGTENVIVKKVLGTLNNVAEVEFLRPYLLTDECVGLLSDLLDRTEIQVCYFAGGILSNIALAWEPHMTVTPNKSQIVRKMEKAVLGWDTPTEEMVAYRSFTPFLPLLKSNITAVRLWATWGIHHVCTKNPARYIPLLISDGIKEIIAKIAQDINEDEHLKSFCQRVCEQAKKYLKEDVVKDDTPTPMEY